MYLGAEAFPTAVELTSRAPMGLLGAEATALVEALRGPRGAGHRRALPVRRRPAWTHGGGPGQDRRAGRAAPAGAGDRARADLHRLFQHALATSKTVTSRPNLGAPAARSRPSGCAWSSPVTAR